MTNEEKAKQTYPYYEDMNDIELVQANAKRRGFIAGCEWKEQEFIDRACKWLDLNSGYFMELNYEKMERRGYEHEIYIFRNRALVKEFRKAMKGD